MKKALLLFAALLSLSMTALCQINIPGTGVTFEFPNGGWKYLQTNNIDRNTVVYLYCYSDRAVVDSAGDTVLPFLRIYVRKNYGGELYELAYERYLQQPFQSLKEYDSGLVNDGAIAYDGAYASASDGKNYRFKMMYFKAKRGAVEFRLETTSDTYRQFASEFDDIMDSIEIKD